MDMSPEVFPYGEPEPFGDRSEKVLVQGLESCATRHNRENGNLLVPSIGFPGLPPS